MKLNKNKPAYNRLKLIGKKFGSLNVVDFDGLRDFKGDRKTAWICRCDCGNIISVLGSSLTTGNTKSCGCKAREATSQRSAKHRLTGTRVYRIWQAMLNRCRNKKTINYYNYGGKGISVCKRWESFENFLFDMGNPLDSQSIDRINNNGNYEPNNCKWSTRSEQCRNKSNNRKITLNGRTRTLSEWASDLDICQSSLRERLDNWSLEDALTRPKRGEKNVYKNM